MPVSTTLSVLCFIILFVPMSKLEFIKCTLEDQRDIFDNCVVDYNHMTLWCDQTNFTGIPQPESVISQVSPDRAISLYMNDSCVDSINIDVLSKYKWLQRLNFSDNLLTEIKNQTFSKNPLLREIDISLNYLTELEKDSFAGLTNLRNLNLKKNNLMKLEKGIFKCLVHLTSIDLDENNLTSIQVDIFDDVTQLKVLSVRNNQLRSWIEPNVGQFIDLEEILIDGNAITTLKHEHFAHLPNLRKLSIRSNHLRRVEPRTFQQVLLLEFIDFSNNQLQGLSRDAFQNLCNLQQLYLHGNDLIQISPFWFGNLLRHNLYSISLSENKWKCDCASLQYWLLLQHLEGGRYSHDELDVECSSPIEFHQIKLNSLSSTQLMRSGSCSSNDERSMKKIAKATNKTREKILENEEMFEISLRNFTSPICEIETATKLVENPNNFDAATISNPALSFPSYFISFLICFIFIAAIIAKYVLPQRKIQTRTKLLYEKNNNIYTKRSVNTYSSYDYTESV